MTSCHPFTLDDMADALGKDRIQWPQAVRTQVDHGSMERIQNQLRKDRERGLIKCPVCRQGHPADVACKPGEKADNGYTLTRRED